ncbi:MAG: magnesium transporter, partial [Planctomycetota bacterium]
AGSLPLAGLAAGRAAAAAPPVSESAVSEEDPESPWKDLADLIDTGDSEGVAGFIDELDASDVARAIERLGREHREKVLAVLEPSAGAELLEQLVDAQGGELLEAAEPQVAAAVLQELDVADQADLIATLEPEDAKSILAEMPAEAAREAEFVGNYAPDTAGRMMDTEFLAFPQDSDAGRVVSDLRRRADEVEDDAVQYIYVVDREGRLTGVLRLRDLLLSPSWRVLETFMIRMPLALHVDQALDDILDVFDGHAFLAVPVVDGEGVLRGVVHRGDAQEALSERSEREHRRSQGLIHEELRSMRLLDRSRSRLAWLSVNILLNILAASIIASHQDTLSAVIALAVFLPIISDMSGCSGNQAVAVSMRELALGITKPTDILYVWRKEVVVGVLNGSVLGAIVAVVAWLWKGNPWLGLVVGAALALNTVIAVSVGGTVPLILKRFGRDPALASGPILTTVTDMCGFFLVLSMASTLMRHLA